MIENIFEITKEQLMNEVHDMSYSGYRFITASCVDTGDGSFDVIYSFDKDAVMKHFRLRVQKEEEISSISKIYLCALLVENEMKELFGLNVTNIAIDYGGHLLLADGAPDTPMAKQQITIVQKGDTKNV